MSSDDDLSVIIFMVLGTASAVAAAAGTFFGTRKQECQGEFTPWSPCVGECDEVPTRSRKYVITKSAPDCPYIDGYTETEACDQITPCCELVRDWEDPGDVPCEGGLKKFTRELKENAPGACEGFDTEEYTPCCEILGQWQTVGECGQIEPGKQKYTKDYRGECPSNEVEKYEGCAPCVEGWDQYTTGLPSCPPDANDCGFSGASFKRTWKILQQPVGTGKQCTKADGTEEAVECPAQPPCCDYTNWSTDGVCASDGQLTYTRNYVNSSCKEDPNMNNTKSYTEPCCYEGGDWAPVGVCEQVPDGMDEEGNMVYVNRQKQVQTTAGPCPEGTGERYVPCCGYTEWTPDGQCEEQQVIAEDAASGVMTFQTRELQRIKREIGTTIEGCGKEEEPFTESLVPCCGYKEWTPSGQCSEYTDATTGEQLKRQQLTRQPGDVEGCAVEEVGVFTDYAPCCGYTEWTPSGQCSDYTLDNEEVVERQQVIREPGTTVEGCAVEEQPFTSDLLTCCGYTEWTPSGTCFDTTLENGQEVRRQTVVREPGTTTDEACAVEQEPFTSNLVACCGYSEWTPSGACVRAEDDSLEPSQMKIREVLQGEEGCYAGDEELSKTEPCCYEEDDWAPVEGGCPSDGQQKYTRTVHGSACVPGEDDVKYEPCAPCVEGWDTSACPTEPGFAGNDPSRVKTWRITTAVEGTGTPCSGDYQDGDTAPCDATPVLDVPCEGSWSTDFPECPPTDQCGYEGGTFTRTWTTNTAPPGQRYVGCPPASESKTCPAVADCDEGVVSGGVIGGGVITGIVAGTAGGAAAWYCTTYPDKCNVPPNQPPSIRDDVDVNCVGEFDKDVPACVKTCGQSAVDYTATYKQIIPQQGGGAYCPYPDGYSYTRYCEATPPCCTYSTVPPLVTGPGVCNAPPGVATTAEVQVRVNNEPCQEDGTAPTSRYEPCTNCYGFWEADACPTGCGYPGGTVVKNWVTLTDSVGYGEACPSPTTMTCPATPACEQSCAA